MSFFLVNYCYLSQYFFLVNYFQPVLIFFPSEFLSVCLKSFFPSELLTVCIKFFFPVNFCQSVFFVVNYCPSVSSLFSSWIFDLTCWKEVFCNLLLIPLRLILAFFCLGGTFWKVTQKTIRSQEKYQKYILFLMRIASLVSCLILSASTTYHWYVRLSGCLAQLC